MLPFNVFTPPPIRSNKNKLVIGFCGGCALILVLIVGGCTFFGIHYFNKYRGPVQRIMVITKFSASLQKQDYEMADTMLTAQAQRTWPPEKLKAKIDGLEKKNGSLLNIQLDSSSFQRNMALEKSVHPLNAYYSLVLYMQKRNAKLDILFSDVPAESNLISKLKWVTDNQGNSSDGFNKTASEKKKKR